MWSLPGKQVDTDKFFPFSPDEVFYEFDGPRVFTIRDCDGELSLACWSDEDEQIARYIVAPTTPQIIGALCAGEISVFDALDQPRCWLCDVTSTGELVQCQRVDFSDVPRDSIPAMGTLLWPSLALPNIEQTPGSETQFVELEGRVRELDKDRLSFELREIAEGTSGSQRFVFDKALLEDVFQAFRRDVRVKVAGRTLPIKNLAYALALSSPSHVEPPA